MEHKSNNSKMADSLARLNGCEVEAAILEKRGRFFIIVAFDPSAPTDSAYLTAAWKVGENQWWGGDYGFSSYKEALAAAIARAGRQAEGGV